MELWKMAVPLMVLIFIAPVYAQVRAADVTFDIRDDGSVSQKSAFYFDQMISGTINYTLDNAATDIRVSDATHQLAYRLDANVLSIFLDKPASTIILEYTVSDVVFRSGQVEHFFTELSFDSPVNITAYAGLPEGYVIYQDSYRPAAPQILSDGRRIILQWNILSDTVLFSVKYTKTGEENTLWIAAIAVLAGSLVFVYLYFRQRRRDDFLFGFRHDEKLVIGYLQERRVALQRDLEEQFKFSRAKATRIVSRLVEKGLVRKQRYGRTNKLTWLK